MRSHLIVLTALAGLLLGAPGHAQTSVNCTTAAQALSFSAHAGKILDLRVTYDDMTIVNGFIRGAVGAPYIGHADNIQNLLHRARQLHADGLGPRMSRRPRVRR